MSQFVTDETRLLLPPGSWSRNDQAPSNLSTKHQISNTRAGHLDFMPPPGLPPRRRGRPHPRAGWLSQHPPWSSTRPRCRGTAPLKTSSTTARPSPPRDARRQPHPRRGTTPSGPSPSPSNSTRPSSPSRHPLSGSTRDALPNAGGYPSPRPSRSKVQ